MSVDTSTVEKIGTSTNFKLLDIKELLKLPDPEWLLEGFIEAGSFSVLYGPSGAGKSFVALDWGLSIANGTKWQDKATKKGKVVYIVAEGTGGMPKRVRAWLQSKGLETVDGAFFLLEAPQPRNRDDLKALIDAVKTEQPVLIIFDTLAQTAVGADENSSQEMGEWVNACRQLRVATGAAVLAIHHTGKTGDVERGSSALRAAADSMTLAKQSNQVITLRNDKQKDEEHTQPVRLRLKSVEIANSKRPSCVLISAGGEIDEAHHALCNEWLEALKILSISPIGLKSGMWQATFVDKTHLSSRSFYRCRKTLLELGYVETIPGSKSHYQITGTGQAAIGVTVLPQEKNSESLPNNATPPKGWHVADELTAEDEALVAMMGGL